MHKPITLNLSSPRKLATEHLPGGISIMRCEGYCDLWRWRGQRHRNNGPALVNYNSSEPNVWYIHGRRLEYQSLLFLVAAAGELPSQSA